MTIAGESSQSGRSRYSIHTRANTHKHSHTWLNITLISHCLQLEQKVVASAIFSGQKDCYPQSVPKLFVATRLGNIYTHNHEKTSMPKTHIHTNKYRNSVTHFYYHRDWRYQSQSAADSWEWQQGEGKCVLMLLCGKNAECLCVFHINVICSDYWLLKYNEVRSEV